MRLEVSALLDVFHTLAEVAVAITGFSSLVIIFRGSSADWSRLDYVSFSFVLTWSIGCIFLSLLPLILVEFEISVATASRIGLYTTIVYMCVASLLLARVRYRISLEDGGRAQGRESLFRTFMNPMTASFVLIIVVASLAGRGTLPGPQHAWYALTIVFLMVHATAELGLFVMRSAQRSSDA